MPSDPHTGWGRSSHDWRVKAGKKVVFKDPVKQKCTEFMRERGGKTDGKKLKLCPPNA